MRMRAIGRMVKLLPWYLCALAPVHTPALTPTIPVRAYLHRSWTEGGRKPLSAIFFLSQTPDGYLWLGNSKDLIRFDGNRFSDWSSIGGEKLPGEVIYAFTSSRAGGFWIAVEAGVARLSQGRVRYYPLRGWRHNVASLLEDAAGRVWVVAGNGPSSTVQMFSPADGSLRPFSQADGLPAEWVRAMALDGDGFWLGTEGGVCRWTPGRQADCRRVGATITSLAVAGPAEVYAAGAKAIFHVSSGRVEAVLPELRDFVISRGALFPDRHHNLWVGTTGGLLRIRGRKIERLTRKDGLSGGVVSALLEDREGDLWIGANNGIDRLRDPRVLHISSLDGLSGEMVTAVQATRDGATWIATNGNGMNRFAGGGVRQYAAAEGLPGTATLTLYEDPAARLWAGGDGGLAYFDKGRFREVRAAGGKPLPVVYAIAGDGGGAIWAITAQSGFWRVRGDQAEPLPSPQRDVLRILSARDGVLWMGTFAHGAVRTSRADAGGFGSAEGVGPGPARAIYQDSAGAVWIGAGSTLTRFRNGKSTTWGSGQGFPEGEIYGITADASGGLWIVTAVAALRADLADLSRSLDGAPQSIRLKQYDNRDGLRLNARSGLGSPRITTARDGCVWIAEQDGVARMEPELLRTDPVAPPVAIEELSLDGQRLESNSRSFRGGQLRIAYTGVSLLAPERVRFRYRLEPVDRDWVDADTRREVTFVNLSPRRYRFRVIAANLDGVWNEAGAAVDFRIEPFVYQTFWFRALLALSAGSLAWIGYRLRVRQIRVRFQVAAQERARVTREVHDSLLQGFAGVVYLLDAASRQFQTDPAASKQRLDRALDQADQSLREARQMILEMRGPLLEDRTLPEALSDVGARAAAGGPAAFRVETEGPVAPLPEKAQAALFLIGREAITNAARHASARQIAVRVVYREREVRLTVSDDGAGFDPEAAKGSIGHFGLRSMRERAQQAGADFQVDTAPGQGTRIEVVCKRP